MPRTIWKGEISFGLVNVPVNLYSAEIRTDIHLHMVDSRNLARIRYERVNAESGEEVPWDAIVKGYEFDNGQYVLLSEEELENVDVKLTRTIEIEDFVDASEISFLHFERPYFLEPQKRGAKGYALLRETLRMTNRAGIARVVIRSKEYLTALMVCGDALVLILLRFAQELRSAADLSLPRSEEVQISEREAAMAVRLIEEMTTTWNPEKYEDAYRQRLLDYIEVKVERGELKAIEAARATTMPVSTAPPMEAPAQSWPK